jgi:hypothetical protein
VDNLGGGFKYDWAQESLVYGKFPDGKEKLSPVDHVLFDARRQSAPTSKLLVTLNG